MPLSNIDGTILLIGGTSEIGLELAVRLCHNRNVVVAARRVEEAEKSSSRLRASGANQVTVIPFEANDIAGHRALVHQAQAVAGDIAVAIVAFGILGRQSEAEHDEFHAVEIATVDYVDQVSMLTVLADELRKQDSRSTIVAFSSIAGWRARRANYVYGSTKAGLDAFCQGLTDALHGSNVRLFTVRPGFVVGRMTQGMKPAPLAVDAPTVAAQTVAEINRQDHANKFHSQTLWIPRKLRLLAYAFRVTPRFIWRKLPR